MDLINANLDYLRNNLSDGQKYSDDQLFNYLTLQYLCYKNETIDSIQYDLVNNITDGSNDGGIDYVFFDYDENKVIIGQNKFSNSIDINSFVSEINKILSTLADFSNGRTGRYNNKLKETLQNALDNLSSETEGNIDIYFVSNSSFNKETAYSRIEEATNRINSVEIFNLKDFNEVILKLQSTVKTVEYERVNLDQPQNYVEYETSELKGAFLNISSKSITQLYNKYHTKGLFNLNIRRYIKSKAVDDGIKDTLDKNRDQFWFLNNGLTIACEEYRIDGNVLNLTNFSIVNGGQTTTLIGQYKGTNNEEFFIPCKVIQSTGTLDEDEKLTFFNRIAEATNSQKPIQPRDLKSNSPEMVRLKRLLINHDIFLEIKRGETTKKDIPKIKNDELAQIIFSFVAQKPGTARSAKRSLFSNNSHYTTIFKQNYSKDKNKTDFLVDLIKLKGLYDIVEKELKANINNEFNTDEASVYNNSKILLFALFGVMYRITNNDTTLQDLNNDPTQITKIDFEYGKFISNYREDDIYRKIKELVKYLVEYVTEEYENKFKNGDVTSVSNFLKSDARYLNDILKKIATVSRRERNYNHLMDCIDIFKR